MFLCIQSVMRFYVVCFKGLLNFLQLGLIFLHFLGDSSFFLRHPAFLCPRNSLLLFNACLGILSFLFIRNFGCLGLLSFNCFLLLLQTLFFGAHMLFLPQEFLAAEAHFFFTTQSLL